MIAAKSDCPAGLSGKRVALTLGSGGARGYAHIGVIEELVARGYEITAISGCSMGALVGGIYAAGKLEEYRQWVEGLGAFGVLRLLDLSFGTMGAMQGRKLMGKIGAMIGEINIEDLPIAFTAVATDLIRQREVWFQKGSLLKAIRASIAIPGVFTPIKDGPRLLVDGGLLNPLPIISNVSADADLVMAVNVTASGSGLVTLEDLLPDGKPTCSERRAGEGAAEHAPPEELSWAGDILARRWLRSTDKEAARDLQGSEELGEREWGRLAMILTSFDITQAALARYRVASWPPDILIEVPKSVCGSFEFQRARELVRLGRHLTCQALNRLETCGVVTEQETIRN